MNDYAQFALVWLIISALGARHMCISNAIDKWAAMMAPTPAAHAKDLLLPPFHLAKGFGFWGANLAVIIWGFVLFPWYFAILAPPCLLASIKLAAGLMPGKAGGFKNALLYGLSRKIWVEEKAGTTDARDQLMAVKQFVQDADYASWR
jgi:hypothetical protein